MRTPKCGIQNFRLFLFVLLWLFLMLVYLQVQH